MNYPRRALWPVLLTSLVLAACGGGGGDESASINSSSPASSNDVSEPGAPAATGNTATDGFNWFNFRRQQAGLAAVSRNALLDKAAQNHSTYQRINDVITHEEIQGKRGFTGVTLGDRVTFAGYDYNEQRGYALGEVISATSDASGFNAAEDLLTAIYHRFVILEPMFKEAGAGAATTASGTTYFTTDFAADGLDGGLNEPGRVIVYPFAGQQRVPRNFFSDNEAPDPVPDRNEVGYPVSVHADITSTVEVTSFTMQPRGGGNLATRLLTTESDPQTTATSAAAIVPLAPLAPATTYDVHFVGRVDGVDVDRSWSFTTK